MRLLRVAVLACLLSVLGATVPAASAAGPAGTWGTGISCVNMGTASAMITVKFFRADTGELVLNYPDPTAIAAGAARQYFTPGGTPPGLPSPFIGSAVVESDQPLSCNVNTQTTGVGTASDPLRVDTSKGVSAAATTQYAPQVMKTFSGTWNSYISIQNTGASAASVTVTYKDRNGADVAAATESVNIPANTNHIFYQSDNANLPGNFLGSAKITSSAALAGVVAMYNAASSNADSQFLTYNTIGTGANKVLVPRIVRNYYGYNGGLTIQNVGAAATSVTLTFSFAGATYSASNPALAPGAAWALYAPNITAIAPVDALAVSLRFGSAIVQAGAGGSVVAIVNEDNRGGGGIPAEAVGQGAVYNAMNDGTQTTTVSFAQITKNAGGFYSGGFNVANTTNTAGTCNISYAGAPAANETGVALPANGSFKRFAPAVPGLPASYNSSVTVTCTQAVVGISNLAANSGSGKLGDSFTQVAGTNQ